MLSRSARRWCGHGGRGVPQPLVVSWGARPLAITNCLNFGSPEKPEGYYQLAESIEGMAQRARLQRTPVVSGNVSSYNETEAGVVYPTPVVGMVGVLEDVSRHATPALKREGDMVVVVWSGPEVTLAGSEYLEIVHGKVAGRLPEPDLLSGKKTSDLVRRLVAQGLWTQLTTSPRARSSRWQRWRSLAGWASSTTKTCWSA